MSVIGWLGEMRGKAAGTHGRGVDARFLGALAGVDLLAAGLGPLQELRAAQRIINQDVGAFERGLL